MLPAGTRIIGRIYVAHVSWYAYPAQPLTTVDHLQQAMVYL